MHRRRGSRPRVARLGAAALGLALLTSALDGCHGVDGDAPAPRADSDRSRTPGSAGEDAAGPSRPPARRVYHKADDQPYRFENSLRGLAFAAHHGYDWIDVDSNYCWDDARRRPVALATHWPRIDKEGFDPGGRHPAATRWSDLTLTEVRRLATAEDPPYRVSTMVEMVRRAAALGLRGIEWEVKPGAEFERPRVYRRVLRVARRVGIAIAVKTVLGLGGTRASWARLRAAKRAGATTLLVNTGSRPVRLTPRQAKVVDHVRGPWTGPAG